MQSWCSDGFIDTHEGKFIWWNYHNDTMSSWYNDISLPYKMLQQENHHVCLIWWREIGNILLIKSDILVMQSYIPVLDFYLVCVFSFWFLSKYVSWYQLIVRFPFRCLSTHVSTTSYLLTKADWSIQINVYIGRWVIGFSFWFSADKT